MKLKSYRSDQFAGMRNQEITFSDGMNVILGDNEAGKSTMIAGVYETLLLPSKYDKRSNKQFADRYMPTNGSKTINGTVAFEHDNHEVKVNKQWGIEPNTTAEIDGVLYSGLQAEENLLKNLQYGEALYQNVIFGWQDNTELVLDWIFNANERSGKEELEEKLKEALSISEGISIDKLESLLNDKIKTLSEHWSLDLNLPENNRGIKNKWRMDSSKINILNSYYAWQEEQAQVEAVEAKIQELENKGTELAAAKKRKEEAEGEYTAFQNDQSRLSRIALITSNLDRNQSREADMTVANKTWPVYRRMLREANQLLLERNTKTQMDILNKLRKDLADIIKAEKDIQMFKAACKDFETIEADCKNYSYYDRQKIAFETQLNSGALYAKVCMQNGHTANIETGTQHIDGIIEQEINVAGYLKLTIPNVGEVLVSPQNLDIQGLKDMIADYDTSMKAILSKYSVFSFDELQKLALDYRNYSTDLKNAKQRRSQLGSLNTLKERLAEIQIDKSVVVREDLNEAIDAFLSENHHKSLEGCIAVCENALDNYVKTYGTQENLVQLLNNIQVHIAQLKDELSDLHRENEIIMDKEQLDARKSKLETRKKAAEDAYLAIRERVYLLENEIGDVDLNALMQSLDAKKLVWEQRVQLCKNYMKIADDLKELKKAHNTNPMELFYQTLSQNLSFITDGQIQLTDEIKKYSLCVRSGRNNISRKEHLSEGTRKTILLAYRLAVLKHFFPNHGGMIVLDDILMDMDPGRRKKSVQLLQQFAEQNQVIFTTCDPNIADMLGGNLIHLQK